MWIVALALRRPYTFVVLALVLMILGPIVIFRTPTDIFPNINIPVVSILWNYTGLNSEEMSNRIVSITERALTTTVDDIEHIESQSLNGIAVVKVFFQPHANIERAIAQVTAISQTQLRQLPPGTTPPLVITYSASSVPILQLALSGQKLSEQQLFDLWREFHPHPAGDDSRVLPFPIPMAASSGRCRWIWTRRALQSEGPVAAGRGQCHQRAESDSSGRHFQDRAVRIRRRHERQPADRRGAESTSRSRHVGSTTIYIRDVAYVRDGFPPQTNIVRVNGQRASLLTVLKTGNASTLDIISGIKRLLPEIEAALPPTCRSHLLADQSIFVRASINGVLREALIAACLTGLMILIFLGSWRSTVIIAVSIPLSILTSIIVHERAGRDDQHHDPGRTGAGGGHSGGRRDGGDREHQPQHRAGERNSSRRFWMARSRSRCRRSFPRSPSASSLCPCSS